MKGYSIPSCQAFGARLLVLLGALAILILMPQLICAQDNALISGSVHDKSGAAVAEAQVVVTNSGGNLTRTTETNGEGNYVVSALPSGTYNVTVSAKGFEKFSAEKVVLEVAQKKRIDIELTVGLVTEEVTVTGENVAQLDTQSSEISGTITGKQLNKLVLNGRNFTQLVNTVPGVVDQTGADEGNVGVAGSIAYSVNGGRTEYNNWEIDGGDNMDNGSNATLNVYPNLEAIAEFKVLTSSYGAQYGKSGSGTIEVETKSGTNTFHGSLFYYGRNEDFNANSWENNGLGVARPAYKKHDYGYTIGGPVFIPGHYNTSKTKTFFFWSQEWRHNTVPGSTISQAVPSAAERTGNFNDVCFGSGNFYQTNPLDGNGNSLLPAGAQFAPDCPAASLGPSYTAPNGTVIQSYVPYAGNQLTGPYYGSSTAAALNSLIPAANNFGGVVGSYTGGPNAGANIPAYVSNPSYPTTWREELIRVDQNLTENERLTFRYIHDSWNTVVQGPEWGVYGNSFDNTNTNFSGPTTSFVARLTSNISPTLLNEFVASYTSDHIFLQNASNVGLPSGGINLTPFFDNNFAGKIPAFSVGNTQGSAYGGGFSVDTGYFPWKNANPTYTYRDIMTKIHGQHTFFFGGYLVFAQKNQSSTSDPQGQLSFATNATNSSGNPYADLLLGQVGGYAQTSQQVYFYDRYKIFEPFVQDDWRVTKKLTLNLGLRWSFFGRYQEKFANEYNFSPNIYNPGVAMQYYPFNDPDNSQLLISGSGNPFNGFQRCGYGSPTPIAPGIAAATTGCMNNKLVNPGPRIGFAYDPFGDGKWAIRGGYGIFFEHMNGNEANAESLQGNPSPLISNAGISNINGYENVGVAVQSSAVSPLGATSIPSQAQWPYMQQWNLGVQHEFAAHIVASIAYVGSKGTHLARQFDLNQLTPVPANQNPYLATKAPIAAADCNTDPTAGPVVFTFDPNGLPTGGALPNGAPLTQQAATNLFIACGNATAGYYRPYQGYGSITRIENSASSNYNSLQLTARRSFGDITFTAGYTWSHSIDDSSDRYDSLFVNSQNPDQARASSNFDVRQALTLSYVWDIPIFRGGSGWKHTLLGGWQFSGTTIASTGVPFTVTNGTTFADNSGVANGVGIASFPDTVGNPNVVPSSVQAAFAAQGTFGKLLYNPLAYTLPVGLTFGDGARNTLRLPGRFNSNLGLFKTFPFKERYAFEFRLESFNTFNHTQLDAFSGSVSSGGAGLSTAMTCNPAATADPTCGGFLVLNGAHDPRILQLGLRFQF